MDANIEVDLDRHRDLEKRKLIPLKLIYLQIADPTGKSESGFRALECRGRGQIVFESLPALPKRLPQEQADIGDTVANLALSATCTRDSAEFGSFVIEGRVVMRVLIIPADM